MKIKFIMKLSKLIIILFFLSGTVSAQIGGKGVYQFLNIPASSRTSALGGMNISIFDDDLNMSVNNPALLNNEMTKKVAINFLGYFAGVKSGHTSYAFNIKNYGVFAFGINFLNYGKFTAADETGIKTGEFSASEYAFNLTWSKELFKNINAGVNFKPIISQLERYKSFGIAFDLGMIYRNEKQFSAGLVIKNIGTEIKPYYSGHYEKIPIDFQIGVSKKLEHAPFRFSITANQLHRFDLTYDKPTDNKNTIFESSDQSNTGNKIENGIDKTLRHLVFGVEFTPLKSFYFDLGYNHRQRKELAVISKTGVVGFAWGFGLKLKRFDISYSRVKYHLSGSSNHIGLMLHIDKLKKLTKAE